MANTILANFANNQTEFKIIFQVKHADESWNTEMQNVVKEIYAALLSVASILVEYQSP